MPTSLKTKPIGALPRTLLVFAFDCAFLSTQRLLRAPALQLVELVVWRMPKSKRSKVGEYRVREWLCGEAARRAMPNQTRDHAPDLARPSVHMQLA